LKGKIQDGSRLSVVSAYFTIYAYDALKDCLDRINHLDFLFGEPSYVNRLDPSKTEKKAAQRHEDQQRLVRRAPVAMPPHANVVEGLEDFVGRHHR